MVKFSTSVFYVCTTTAVQTFPSAPFLELSGFCRASLFFFDRHDATLGPLSKCQRAINVVVVLVSCAPYLTTSEQRYDVISLKNLYINCEDTLSLSKDGSAHSCGRGASRLALRFLFLEYEFEEMEGFHRPLIGIESSAIRKLEEAFAPIRSGRCKCSA